MMITLRRREAVARPSKVFRGAAVMRPLWHPPTPHYPNLRVIIGGGVRRQSRLCFNFR